MNFVVGKRDRKALNVINKLRLRPFNWYVPVNATHSPKNIGRIFSFRQNVMDSVFGKYRMYPRMFLILESLEAEKLDFGKLNENISK